MSINGANRLGSNSLPELLVFGARAGRAAAMFAAEEQPPGRQVLAHALDEEARLEEHFLQKKEGGRERVSTIREEMQKTMEESAGIYRSGESLRQGADKLRELQERFRCISLDDPVPLGAVVRAPSDPRGFAVFRLVERAGKTYVEAQVIQIGQTIGNSIEVTSGLSAGQRIVSLGGSLVRNGQEVRVLPGE